MCCDKFVTDYLIQTIFCKVFLGNRIIFNGTFFIFFTYTLTMFIIERKTLYTTEIQRDDFVTSITNRRCFYTVLDDFFINVVFSFFST